MKTQQQRKHENRVAYLTQQRKRIDAGEAKPNDWAAYLSAFDARLAQGHVPPALERAILSDAPPAELREHDAAVKAGVPASQWAGRFGHWENVGGKWVQMSRNPDAPSGPVAFFRDIDAQRVKTAPSRKRLGRTLDPDPVWIDVPRPSTGRVRIDAPEVLADVAAQEASRRRITRPAEVTVSFDQRDAQDWTPAR